MAFNPFNIFRRNQRAIFAVVTVFIMFTFVLSSGMGGGADFFDSFPRWLGGIGKKGEHLCTIAGDKVYARDVDQVRARRLLAAKYLGYASNIAGRNLEKLAGEQAAQGSPKYSMYYQLLSQMHNPAFQGMLAELPGKVQRDPEAKQADKDAAKTLQTILTLAASQGGVAAVPNRTSADAVQFMLWEKKADQLGIRFSDADVKALVEKEFLGQLGDDREIATALRKENPQRFSDEAVLAALAAEFRVRAAQTALLGPLSVRGDRTLSAPPIFNTPYELFEFYRDKTSGTNYEALAVPAAAFVSRITETPPDADLQRLFNDRKDFEPNPSKDVPGFREPRKAAVQWASAGGDEPYYEKAAAAHLTQGPVAAALVVPTFGGWDARVFVPVAATDPLLRQKYDERVKLHEFAISSRWDRPTLAGAFGPLSGVLDTSVVKPQTVAAAAAGGAGAAFGGGLFPVNLFAGAVVATEERARVKAGMPLFLGGVPGPGLLPRLVGAEAAHRASLPPAFPLDVVRPGILKELAETKAHALAVADLKTLQTEVSKLADGGRPKDKGAAAKAFVDQFAAARGLKTGATAEPVTEWTVTDDPALAPLKAVMDKGTAGGDPHRGMANPVKFGQRVFYNTDSRGSRTPASGVYLPEFYPETAATTPPPSFGKPDPVFLAWRTAEEPARGVTFQQAGPKGVEAWKRNKARDLAKAEAERLAADIRNYPGASRDQFVPHMVDLQLQLQATLTDPAAKDRVKLFRIDDVAPLQIGPGVPGSGMAKSVQPFQVTASDNIPYPTPDMTKTLLDDRTKPAKTVAVLPDQPKDTYYVFVVADRKERLVDEFRSDMYGGAGQNPVTRAIMSTHSREAVGKLQDSVQALLKREFDYKDATDAKTGKPRLEEADKRAGDDGI